MSDSWYDLLDKYYRSVGMKVSAAGIGIVKGFESLELKAYPDPGSRDGKPWTIGFGHTRGVRKGDVCTYEEAIEWLKEDLEDAEQTVNGMVDVPLTQYQFDALVSFVYNVGSGQFRISTLRKLLNKKDYEGAAREFPKWRYNDGKEMAGLVRRRKAERTLFEGGDWSQYL